MKETELKNPSCKDIPILLSSFVDTFVDFSVSGGIFLPNTDSKTSQTATRYPAPDRLIAVGDLHGDIKKSKEALRLAGLIDGSDKWIGGSATVVQTGDVLDRGGSEIKILYLLEKLKRESEKCGGKVITMNGNHEIMNVEGDFRFVSKKGLKEFENWANWYCIGNKMKTLCVGLEKPRDLFSGIPLVFKGIDKEYCDGVRARVAALRPDGPIARRFLSKNVTVLAAGDSVFVHGRLMREHVEYGLERINQEVRDWINALMGTFAPGCCKGRTAVVRLRKFSDELAMNCDCLALEHALATIPGVRRMIMGHTIQREGINSVCDYRAIRIDVGTSKGCKNGFPEVLEIKRNSGLQVLTSNPLYQNKSKEGLPLLLPDHTPKQVKPSSLHKSTL